MEKVNAENIEEQVRLSPLADKDKSDLLAVCSGKAFPELY